MTRDANPAMSRRDRFLLAGYPADYRARYGREMLAASRERGQNEHWPGVADVFDLLLGAARVRASRLRRAKPSWSRDAWAVIGVLTPVVLLAGLADDVHEIAWFVWYGGFTDIPWHDTAITDASYWLGWIVVAALAALGWRRTATGAAWLVTAGMLVGIQTGGLLPTPATSGWLLLALLAALAITRTPANHRGLAVVGGRRWLAVVGADVFVVFARLLGHHFLIVDAIAWLLLAGTVGFACRPATMAGRRALVLLSAPATVALGAAILMNAAPIAVLPVRTPWPLVAPVLYGTALLVLTALAVALRRYERRRKGKV